MDSINPIIGLDRSVFFFFNSHHNAFWDVVMRLMTDTPYWLIFYLPIIIYIIYKYRMKSVIILILIALGIVICDQLSGIVKESVQRLRPTHDPSIKDMVHYVISRGGKYGYFSSHASNTFFAAMFTSRLFHQKRFSYLIFFWAALVSYTRIYLGVHYPLDILSGLLFGLMVGYLLYRLLLFIETRFWLLKLPKITDIHLSKKEFQTILIIFLTMIGLTLIIVARLQHYHMIVL